MANILDLATILKQTASNAAVRSLMPRTTVTDISLYNINGRGFHAHQIYKFQTDEDLDPNIVSIIGLGNGTGVGK
jgi:hypothetical protein